MVVWLPHWPVHCLVVDLPPGGVGAVVHADRIEEASAAARRAGVRSGMSVREATFLCPDLLCMTRDPDREARAFSAVVDAFDSVAAGVQCMRPGLARCRVPGSLVRKRRGRRLGSGVGDRGGCWSRMFRGNCRRSSRLCESGARGTYSPLRRDPIIPGTYPIVRGSEFCSSRNGRQSI